MLGEWMVEIMSDPSDPQGVVVQVSIKDAQSGKTIQLVPACRSVKELRREFEEIKVGLEKTLAEAEQELEAAFREGAGANEITPQEVWKKMESLATEEEMFGYFNSFGEAKRQQIAEYIFSHANMFKGRGPVFASCYDASSQRLE